MRLLYLHRLYRRLPNNIINRPTNPTVPPPPPRPVPPHRSPHHPHHPILPTTTTTTTATTITTATTTTTRCPLPPLHRHPRCGRMHRGATPTRPPTRCTTMREGRATTQHHNCAIVELREAATRRHRGNLRTVGNTWSTTPTSKRPHHPTIHTPEQIPIQTTQP